MNSKHEANPNEWQLLLYCRSYKINSTNGHIIRDPPGTITALMLLNCLGISHGQTHMPCGDTVYPKKYAHGFVVLCFVVVMQSFIMNSHEVFIHIHQGCFAGTGAIVRLPQCQWSKPDGYGKISQCITTTKHSKARTVCIFLGIYCTRAWAIYTTDFLLAFPMGGDLYQAGKDYFCGVN